MNLGRNILWNIAAFLWLSLVIVFVTPFMVRRLGLEAFGLWSIITAFNGYLTAMDLGLGNALIRFLALENERGDRRALEGYLQSALTVQAGLGLAGAAILFWAAGPATERWIHVSPAFVPVAVTSFRLAALAVLLGFMVGAYSAVPAALHRFDLLALRTILLFSLQYSMIIAVLWRGGGLQEVMGAFVLGMVFILLYLIVVSRMLLPSISLRPGWSPRAARDLFKFGRMKFPAQISVTLLQQFDRLALGAMLPIAMVSYYAVPLRIAQRLGQVSENVAAPFYPAVTSHLVAQRHEDLGRQYRQGTRIVVAAVCGAIAVLGGLATPLLAVWMGEDFARYGAWPFRMLLLAYGMSALYTLPSVGADAAGRPGVAAFFLIAGAVLHMIVILVAVPHLGLGGAALGVLIGFAVPFFFGVPFIHRRIPALPSVPTLIGDVRGALLAAAITLLATGLLSRQRVMAMSWPTFLLSLGVSSGMYLALLFAFRGLRVDDFRRFTRAFLPRTRGAHR